MTTTKSWLGMIGVALLIGCVGCSGTTTPIAPSSSQIEIGSASGPMVAATSSELTVTLQPDLTASPSTITVPFRSKLTFVNNSARYVKLRANCSEFITMGLQPGDWRQTMEFEPAGSTCDYYTWDTNWSRKIFVGRVYVQ
jgi:hypothetical protein